MAPPYHNLPPPPPPLHEDDHHHYLFHLKLPQTSSSNISPSSPLFINLRPHHHDHQPESYSTDSQPFQLHDQLKADKVFPHGGGSCDQYPAAESESENIWKNNNEDMSGNENDESDRMNNFNSGKWMSSKMRMMRKMMSNNPDQASTDSPLYHIAHKVDDHKKHPIGTESSCNINSSNNHNTIRVCADCNTTKTPLWRSGPRGPKSLCNACGIRQRKARRAMAAAANNGTSVAVEKACMKSNKGPNKLKDKKSSRNAPQFKKRRKQLISSSCQAPNNKYLGKKKKKQQLCFEDVAIGLSNNSAFQRVFPQDEKEAAILLMALSYGLVHG